MIIRPFKSGDLNAVLEVVKNAKLKQLQDEKLSEETSNEIIARLIERTKSKIEGNPFFVAEIDQDIVGVVGLRPDDGSSVPDRVSTYFVEPEYQGQGIGRQLFDKALAEAKSQGARKLVVNSSPFAEPIYTHFGFTKIKELDHGQVWMEMSI